MLIPADIRNDIQCLMNGYWWGSGRSRKGIRWMTWEKICTSKERGGLGFRELNQFNLAMLAKKGWTLFNNENSLVTSLLEAWYFSNSDFLSATLGNNPSYIWRSILVAQEFVKQGCRRRIGNGESAMVWKVPWIHYEDNGFLMTDMPLELQNITVQSLMVPG